MKKSILSLLILMTIHCYPQYSFETHIDTDYDQRSFQILDFNNSFYVIGTSYLENGKSQGVIYKVNQSGNLVDSLIYQNDPMSSLFCSSIVLDNENIRVFGTLEKSNMPGFYDLCWLDLDENMNIIDQQFFDAGTGRWWGKFHSQIKENRNISIVSIVDGSPPNGGIGLWDKFIIEMTQEGDVVFDSIYNQTPFESIMDYIRVPNSPNYLIYCMTNFEGGSVSKAVNIINSNYELQENFYIEDRSPDASIRVLNDSTYVTCTKSSYSSDKYEPSSISISLYNQVFNRTKNIRIGSPDPDSLSYPAELNSLIINSTTDILFAYTYRSDAGFSSKKSFFALGKLSDELELQWLKYFGGDAQYYLCDTKPTEDGGCVMLGTRYEHGTSGPFERDMVVVKVNPDGTITNIDENTAIPILNAIISPNPGKNYLQLHTGIYPSQLQIFNINGQLVLEEDIQENATIINTTSLSSGTYIWQLIKDGEVVENGKWVKE